MAWVLALVILCSQISLQTSAQEVRTIWKEGQEAGSGLEEAQADLPETVSGADAGAGNDGALHVPGTGAGSDRIPAVSGSDAAALLGARAGGSVEVTRLEWLKALTEVFQMSVEEDNYPDNYYSDIDSSSEDYYDIMLATEFGLVDVEAGDPLRPDEAATREFAAHTLNLCLGYLPEEGSGYTFSEASSVTYPDDIQTAINKGWLKLSGGSFLPEKGITAAEKAHMIAAAQTVLDSTRIDASAGSRYQLVAGVIAVPEGTEAVLTDDNEITLHDCSVKIAAGDIFVVVSGGIPIARRAVAVANIDNKTVITVESVETEEAFTSLDTQGSMEADLTRAQAIGDDVQLAYIVGGTPEQDYEDGITYYSLRDVEDREVTAVIATKTIDVPQGAGRSVSLDRGRITVSCKIANPSLDWKIDGMSGYINLSADVIVDAGVKLDDLAEFDLDQPFVRVPIGVVGYFAPTVEGKVGGKMTFTQKGNFSIGIQCNPKDGVRLSASFRKDKFTVVAKVELTLGVKVAVGVDVVVVKAELYAKAGVKASVKKTVYTDNNLPKSCVHLSAHLYALVGGSVRVKFFGFKVTFKQELKIYDEKNSPVKVALHYDDGIPVSVCARDSKTGSSGSGSSDGYKYYTPINSQYGYSGVNSGTLPSGKPFTFFEYTLDKYDQATITKYNGNVAALSIPETIDGYTVVGIKASVFQNNTRIQLVTIPDSVTEIGTSAFRGCSNLTDVILSGNLEKLGGTVFENCVSLTGITIPKSLKESGFNVFKGAVNLKEVTFEEGVTLIPDNLFSRSSIEEIVIPDTVTEIGEKAFMNCESLRSVSIPDSVGKIGVSAFYGCIHLREIRILDSVTEIGDSAFRGCSNLSDVILSGNLEKLGGTVFENCVSLTGITIPKSLKESGFGVFDGAVNLKGVTFEEGVTLIPDHLFSGSSIEEIVIPDTVTEIGDKAFMNCESLRSVSIPDSVGKIGVSAFYNCTHLREISIPDSVVKIGTYAFFGCSSLVRVRLPKGRKEIPESLFQGCTSLASIELPDSVTSIGHRAFQNCTSLTAITIPDSVTSIGGYAFQNCDSLTAIRIPDSVTSLGTYCFAECDLLREVQLGTGLTKIGSYTFNLCPSLEKIVLPYRMASIDSNAFTNCTKLTQITIPRAVKSIGSNAFSYPTRMTVYGISGTYAEEWAKSVKAAFINQEKPATAVSFSETAVTLNKGSSTALILSVAPADFTDEVTWKSSNTSVAVVSDAGVVTTKGIGEAVIRVNVGDKSASCKVTVVQPVTSISLNKTSYSMEAEAVYTLTATAKPSTAKDRTVTWSSSDENIATVDENGRVTALRKGTAVITATAKDGSGVSKSCTVTVTNTLYRCAAVTALESPHNYESNCSDLWVYTLPGAARIAVTFDERTEMEDGFDYLYLYDGSGTEIGKYTGKELAGQTVTLSGDTIKIRLVSDKGGSTWGFKVVKVEKRDSAEKAVTGVVKCPGTGTGPTAIQLIGADGKVAAQTSVGNNGTSYGLEGVAAGTYTLRVSRQNYVSRDYTVTVGSQPIELDAEIWLAGDVNGDGKINAMDKRIIYNHITSPALAGYEFAVGDVNGDGKINAMDKRRIYNHIEGTSPLW